MNDRILLERVPVQQIDGQPITLGDLADIQLEESPPGIEHEAGRRRTFVQVNVRDRDVASFVQEAKQRIAQDVELPPGFAIQWGGDFENLQSASLRLSMITPLVLLLIFSVAVHVLQVHSPRDAHLSCGSDGGLRRRAGSGPARDAFQYFRRASVLSPCSVWRCSTAWYGSAGPNT